jgi:hypothetical protein
MDGSDPQVFIKDDLHWPSGFGPGLRKTNASIGWKPSFISSSPSTWTDQTDECLIVAQSQLFPLICYLDFLSLS